jgi:hypothetical protein
VIRVKVISGLDTWPSLVSCVNIGLLNARALSYISGNFPYLFFWNFLVFFSVSVYAFVVFLFFHKMPLPFPFSWESDGKFPFILTLLREGKGKTNSWVSERFSTS